MFGRPGGDLGGLKLDEIDAANSFLMLPMARNGFKWPVKTSKKINKILYFLQYDYGLVVSVIAKCLGRVTMQKSLYCWKRTMILAEDYDLGRG